MTYTNMTEYSSKQYMTKENIQKLETVDYLTLPEISKRAIKQIRPDMLYRTHVAIHTQAKSDTSKKIVKAHKLVADELKTRGFMHHRWSRLDTIYYENN